MEEDEESAFRILKEINYGAGDASHTLEDLMNTEISKMYNLIHEISPEPQLTDLFWLSADAHNLKVLFKSRIVTAPVAEMLCSGGCFDPEVLRISVQNGDYSLLPYPLNVSLSKLDEDMEAGLRDPGIISGTVDKSVSEHISYQLKKNRNQLLTNYFSSQIDFINIVSMLRAKELNWDKKMLIPMLLPGGETSLEMLCQGLKVDQDVYSEMFQSNSNYDVINMALQHSKTEGVIAAARVFQNALIDKLKQEKEDSFGVGPVACYIVNKQNEAKQLRMLFAAKRAGIKFTPAEFGI